MNASFFKSLVPHAIAIAIFLVVAVVYCQPALQGKVLNQSDIQGWKGMAQQSFEYKEKYGHFPYWSNSMFGGMPGYSFAYETPTKISVVYLHNIFTLGLPKPINFFFLACWTMYFLLMVFRVNPWVGVMGAIAYAYSTYDPVIVAVGHDTKMICIAYAPAVLASLFILIKGRYLTGTVLTALFASLIIIFNHVQITYYTFIIALCTGIAFAIHYIRIGRLKHVLVSLGLALLAGGIALALNTATLWPFNEYSKETMRGGRSELTDSTNAANRTAGGLDKDYAFMWSYGISESLTMVVPGIYGGSNGGNQLKPGDSEFAEQLTEVGFPEENAMIYANGYAYWGDQPNTAGPVYLGATICFLFILAMVYLRGWVKWGFFAASLFGIILSWGSNLPAVNYFLFDYMPFYNKFRAPSMALVIPQLCFVVLACLVTNELLFGSLKREEAWRRFKLAAMGTAGLFAILVLMYFTMDYTGKKDADLRQSFASNMLQQAQGQQPTPEMQQQADEFGRTLLNALEEDRKSLFGKDLLRSLILVLLVAGALGYYIRGKIKATTVLIIVLLLTSFDLLAVGRRYLNNSNFVEEEDFDMAFRLSPADQQIKSDPDKYFRVFDQTAGDPFQDARASYYHNSVGGYHAAKLALFEDLKNRQLMKGNMNAYNMLNAKYFIMTNPTTQQPEARVNPGALGNAWFVKGITFAKNADEEMRVLDYLNVRDSAVVDARFKNQIPAQPAFDSAASISLIENLIDKISYRSSATSNQFAVFSEIYYPHGWNVYVDGKKAEYVRVNYALRGMVVPAGNHTIEFRFEPRSVILGDKITAGFTILVYLMLIAAIFFEVRRRKQQGRHTDDVNEPLVTA